MARRQPRARGHARGLTLIELVFALGVLGLLVSLAMPPFGEAVARARLRSAAEDLALDLAATRLESLRPGAGTLHVTVQPGTAWCWAIGPVPQADCRGAAPGAYKVVHGEDYPGITLAAGASASFEGNQHIAGITLAAEFVSPQGQALRVHMTPLGRASICAQTGGPGDYARC